MVRSVRSVCLLAAAWAVLFAPGAFTDHGATIDVQRAADRLAASVIAPTFGSELFVAARPCRTDDSGGVVDCDQVAAWLPLTAAALALGWLTTACAAQRTFGPATATRVRAARAPPGV